MRYTDWVDAVLRAVYQHEGESISAQALAESLGFAGDRYPGLLHEGFRVPRHVEEQYVDALLIALFDLNGLELIALEHFADGETATWPPMIHLTGKGRRAVQTSIPDTSRWMAGELAALPPEPAAFLTSLIQEARAQEHESGDLPTILRVPASDVFVRLGCGWGEPQNAERVQRVVFGLAQNLLINTEDPDAPDPIVWPQYAGFIAVRSDETAS